MPLVTAVATTSHRLREPPPLLAAASLLPSATPPPSPPPASSADVAAANCRNHPSPPLPTAVTSCRKSTAVADHHSRPPSRSGREARIWGGTAVIAAEHRAVAAQGPMPLSSRRAGLKPRLSRGSRRQRCAHTAAGLFLPRLHTRLHTVVGMLASRRLDGGDPASHAGEDRSGLGGAGSSEEVARSGDVARRWTRPVPAASSTPVLSPPSPAPPPPRRPPPAPPRPPRRRRRLVRPVAATFSAPPPSPPQPRIWPPPPPRAPGCPAAAVLAPGRLSGGPLGRRRGEGEGEGAAAAGACGGARIAPGAGATRA